MWCGGWWCGCGCLWGEGGVIKLCLPDLPRGFSGQGQPDGGWLPLDSLVDPFHFTAFVLPYSVLLYSDFSIAKVEIQLVSLRRQHTQGITCYFIFIFLMMPITLLVQSISKQLLVLNPLHTEYLWWYRKLQFSVSFFLKATRTINCKSFLMVHLVMTIYICYMVTARFKPAQDFSTDGTGQLQSRCCPSNTFKEIIIHQGI